MGYRRYKFFTGVPLMPWGKGGLEHHLQNNNAYYILWKTDHGWNLSVPCEGDAYSKIEYVTIDLYCSAATSPKLLCGYPFKSFREAFMAAKELKEFYANIRIGVSQEDEPEPTFIGESNVEEVAAVLTYE